MAFQPVPNTAEAVVRYTCNSQLCTMTFYGLFAVAYDQSDLDDLAVAMDDWAGNTFLPLLSNQATYTSVEVRGLANSIDMFASNSDSAGPGTIVGNPAPNSIAFAVKRVTGFTGRSARGRVYYPIWMSAISANEDFISVTEANAIVAGLDLVRTYMGAAAWTEVLVSRYTGGALRVPNAVTIPIQNYEYADLELDSQRRRMPSR